MSDTEQESSKLMSVLNRAYDAIVDGKVPGVDSAFTLANEYMTRHGDVLDAAENLVRWQNVKSGTSGFLSGLGGVITIPVALPANVMSVLYVQVRMIAAIAIMGGYNLREDRVRTMVFVCLAGDGAKEILKTAGITAAQALGKGVIKQIPKALVGQINKAVGMKLVSKFGSRSFFSLGKALPILGGVLGAAMDAAATNFIGNVAIRTFLDSDYD